jgi:hypothetical protein
MMIPRILAIGVLIAAVAFAQRGGGGGGGSKGGGMSTPNIGFAGASKLDRIEAMLKLDKDQKKTLKQTFDDAQKEATPVHDQLNKLTLKKMTDVASQNYHPAVRYQAISMIADLHETEPQGRSAGVPLPAALPVLLLAAKSPTVPYEVRIAALAGVVKRCLHFKFLDDVGVGKWSVGELGDVVVGRLDPVVDRRVGPQPRLEPGGNRLRRRALGHALAQRQ